MADTTDTTDTTYYTDFVERLKEDDKTRSYEVPRLRAEPGVLLNPDKVGEPCSVCENAQYNKVCIFSKTCAALTYHTLSRMPNVVKEFFA